MKSGCIVFLGILMAIIALGVLALFVMSLPWIEEQFGAAGVSFAIGGLAVMFVVFFAIALTGAIVFGISGLWARSNTDANVMIATMFEMLPNVIRYSRLPSGSGGQSSGQGQQQAQKGGWSFPPVAGIEYGARPGQQALTADEGPPREEGKWAQLEERYERRSGQQGRHGEVLAR